MNISFKKTVLAIALISSPAITLAAEVNMRSSTNQSSATQVQANQQQLNSDSSVNSNGQANVKTNDQAFNEVRARSESSVRHTVTAAKDAKTQAKTQASEQASHSGRINASIESQNSGEFMIETVDGLSIDLNSNSAIGAAASITTEARGVLDSSFDTTTELGHGLQSTGEMIIDNSVSSAESLSEAVEVNADAQADMTSHSDAFVATEDSMSDDFGSDLSSDMQSQNDASAAGSLTGGLF